MQRLLQSILVAAASLVALLGLAGTVSAQAPTATSFSPTSGPAGTVLTLTGTNFDRDASGVRWTGTCPHMVGFLFDDNTRFFQATYLSSTQLRVTVPVGARTGPLYLHSGGFGIGTPFPGTFTVVNMPRITGFTPAYGLIGSVVRLNGVNFNRNASGAVWTGAMPYRVRFAAGAGTIDATPTFVSTTQLDVTVPAGATPGRLRLMIGQSQLSITTTEFATGTTLLRIVNTAQYPLLNLDIDGVGQLYNRPDILVGESVVLPVAGGMRTLEAYFGFPNNPVLGQYWARRTLTVNVVANTVTTLTLADITAGELLTAGATLRDWSGIFVGPDQRLHTSVLRIHKNGTWAHYIDGVGTMSGSLSTVTWPDNASVVTFRLANNLPNITIAAPFASFTTALPLAGVPSITYQRQ